MTAQPLELNMTEPSGSKSGDLLTLELREAVARAYEHAAQICEQQAKEFLSPQYATGQPLSSLYERFACGQCAEAIRAVSLLPGEGGLGDNSSVEPSPTQEHVGIAQPLTPVAWRVKDFADGWILCHSEAQARREAEGAGNLVQPLYVLGETERYAALGQACEANGLGWFREDGEMLFQPPPDVIEEWATAPLYRRIESLRGALAALVAICEVVDEEYGAGLPVPDEDWDAPLNAARHALSDASASERVTDAPEPSTGRLDTPKSEVPHV